MSRPGGAGELVALFAENSTIDLGVITGNVEPVAWWKLSSTGFKKYFRFGLFGGEANNRIELAGLVFGKARQFFGRTYEPSNITIVGDTIHDVRCAKAIGAASVFILTGEANSEVPADGKPNVVVRSLADPKVRAFFH